MRHPETWGGGNVKVAINAVSAKLGGAVSYLTSLLHHLPPPESGYRFFVFLIADTAKLLPDVPGNIDLRPLPSRVTEGWRRLWWEQVTLRRFLRKENIDALFSTANFAMLRCPVKQVLLVRNALYFSKTYQQMFLGKHRLRYRLAFSLRRWMILRSARWAEVVMTPTQAMLDDLARFVKLDRRKALVNYYGAARQDSIGPPSISRPSPPSLPHPSPPWGRGWTAAGVFSSPSADGAGEGVPAHPAAPAAAAEPGVVRIAYVSLYSEHKNLSTLLKALPLLNRNGTGRFLLKTTVDPAWEGAAWTVTHEDDLALARRPDVAPWVEFLGPLGGKEIQDLYREGNLFVFPSLCESFGHPMVEAMVHGLPIVAADTPVNREMCGEAALYFSPLDSEDLARQIRLVASDASLRQRLRIAAQEQAHTKFRWDAHVGKILEILKCETGWN
jgi:glycosyltransferase involved in cell wall biosynthesis